jgi:hypothetical protein
VAVARVADGDPRQQVEVLVAVGVDERAPAPGGELDVETGVVLD